MLILFCLWLAYLNELNRNEQLISCLQEWDQNRSIFKVCLILERISPLPQTVSLQWWNAGHLCYEVGQEHWAHDGEILPG